MIRNAWIALASVCLAATARSHEQSAHLRITQDALRHTQHVDRALTDAGIDTLEYGVFEINDVGYVLAASRAIGGWIAGEDAYSLIQAGAVLEDGVGSSDNPWCNLLGTPSICWLPTYGEFGISRCSNHFQDPDGRGLSGLYPTAGTWGYDGSDNGYTWLTAISSFTEGILESSPDERRRRLEHAFVALGCNLHLIQDQFSPAHTRDDAHPGHYLPLGESWGGSSLLEENGKEYVRPLPHRNDFHTESLELPSQGTHEGFFASAVEWTNRNFFSDDTIFKEYQLPSPQSTLSSSPPCESSTSKWQYVHSTKLETRLASWPLIGMNPLAEIAFSLRGVPCDGTATVPAVDRVIHDNLAHLIPNATAYSAALLDHFFRGKVDVVVEVGGLRVTNRTQPLETTIIDGVVTHMDGVIRNGSFFVLVEFPDGHRQRLGEMRVPPGGLLPGGSIVVPHRSVPPLALRGGTAQLYVCLSEGWVGDEPAILVAQARAAACDQICSDPTSDPVLQTQVSNHGDLDGDGADDLLIVDMTDPYPQPGPNTVIVRAWSPARCQQLWSTSYASANMLTPGERVGDLSGDGVEDWLALDDDRRLSIRSGHDGTFVRWFPNLADGTAFWRTVPLDDIDSDGYSDIAIGNLFVSGWDGQTLLTASQFAFAPLTRRIGDMNRDGFVDLGVFADFECKFTDGKTGATETWPTEPLPPDDPTNEQVWLNGFTIGSPGDADGDRVPDFVRIGAALDDELKLIGRIAVVSGRTGVMIWHQDAPENTQEAPRIYGDHDGDGHDDVVFVVEDSLGITQATAYSGVDGSWIGDFTRLFSAGYGEFKGLTPAGDCNGDGKTDFIFALKILSGGGQCVRLMFGP